MRLASISIAHAVSRPKLTRAMEIEDSGGADELGEINASGCFGGAAILPPGADEHAAFAQVVANQAANCPYLAPDAVACNVQSWLCADGTCTYEVCPQYPEAPPPPSLSEACLDAQGHLSVDLAEAVYYADRNALDACSASLQSCHADAGHDTYASCAPFDYYGTAYWTCVGRACGRP